MLTPTTEAPLPPQLGIKHYFLVPKYSFAAIGVDPRSIKKPIFSWFLLIVPNVIQFSLCIPMAMYATQYLHDMNSVTDAMAPVWQVLMAILKLMTFLWNKREAVLLVRKLWLWNLEGTVFIIISWNMKAIIKRNSCSVRLLASGEELEIINGENRKDTVISVTFYNMVCVTGVLALAAPFVKATYYSLMGYNFWDTLDPPLRGV